MQMQFMKFWHVWIEIGKFHGIFWVAWAEFSGGLRLFRAFGLAEMRQRERFVLIHSKYLNKNTVCHHPICVTKISKLERNKINVSLQQNFKLNVLKINLYDQDLLNIWIANENYSSSFYVFIKFGKIHYKQHRRRKYNEYYSWIIKT